VAGAILDRREREHHAKFMTFMWFDSLDGVRQFIGEDYEAAPVPAQAQAVLADSGRRSVRYEALGLRAHRCKSSAAQISLSGAALTALRRAKAAEQNGGSARDLAPKAFTERDRARQQAPRLPGRRRSMGRPLRWEFAAAGRGGCDGRPANITR
jgi:hypothetical protein